MTVIFKLIFVTICFVVTVVKIAQRIMGNGVIIFPHRDLSIYHGDIPDPTGLD